MAIFAYVSLPHNGRIVLEFPNFRSNLIFQEELSFVHFLMCSLYFVQFVMIIIRFFGKFIDLYTNIFFFQSANVQSRIVSCIINRYLNVIEESINWIFEHNLSVLAKFLSGKTSIAHLLYWNKTNYGQEATFCQTFSNMLNLPCWHYCFNTVTYFKLLISWLSNAEICILLIHCASFVPTSLNTFHYQLRILMPVWPHVGRPIYNAFFIRKSWKYWLKNITMNLSI